MIRAEVPEFEWSWGWWEAQASCRNANKGSAGCQSNPEEEEPEEEDEEEEGADGLPAPSIVPASVVCLEMKQALRFILVSRSSRAAQGLQPVS